MASREATRAWLRLWLRVYVVLISLAGALVFGQMLGAVFIVFVPERSWAALAIGIAASVVGGTVIYWGTRRLLLSGKE